MLAFSLWYAAFIADPVTLVQLRYPASRTTITTTSGLNVFYSLSSNAPLELRRAYKMLEIAERDVLVTDALQQFRVEIVNNERRLEGLRMARLAAYLTNSAQGPQLLYFDPALLAPADTTLRGGIAIGLAGDATVERAQLALDRFVDAHRQLYQTLVAIAYPDQGKMARQPNPVPAAGPVAVPAAAPAAPKIPAPNAPPPLLAAERAEKVAAEAEAVTAERELTARQNERAAETRYRNSLPADRPAARLVWLKAREEWEVARRDWDAAREKWQAARDQLDAARMAPAPAPFVIQPFPGIGTTPGTPFKTVNRPPILRRP